MFSKGIEVQADSSSLTKIVEPERFESLERVISYNTIEHSYCISVTDEDIQNLMKIVQAEAGGEDRKGKLLVANVVINRVKSSKFPNNVTDVVFQKEQNVTQFSPVSNGTIYNVEISEETREVVYSALYGEDASEGALFFMARKYAEPDSVEWFDENLTYLFSYGGHDFYIR
ncbi:MAG: cell wall hydrolase [Lachnospiraceae bacterium]|nr:cell wall hydrolase [Lachnospiraceae bacterium]